MKQLFTLIILLLLSVASQAQNGTKNDVILQLNGDELAGKVTEITDDAVKFMYAGETLAYSIKKADILKITYASGRIEVFNKPQLASSSQKSQSNPASEASSGSLSDHHNKIAILPFGFVRDGQKAADEMSNVVQAYCFTFLSKHAGVLTVMDTRTTNAKLIKAGVTRENIEGFTMDDICNILGVEFIVDGSVLLTKVSQQTLANASYSDKSKGTRNDQKSSGFTSANSYNFENYETTINLDVYNDKGNNMFTQSRKSFFKTQDAYQNALEYVLKKSPLYSK
jgi:TolB-like protein